MENSNILQVNIDGELIKKLSFVGTMQKVFGVLAIIGGVISCIGIITAIIGIPYIIAGVKLFKSGSAFSLAVHSNDLQFLRNAIFNLASFWMFSLIAIIISTIYYVILIIFVFAAVGNGYYY